MLWRLPLFQMLTERTKRKIAEGVFLLTLPILRGTLQIEIRWEVIPMACETETQTHQPTDRQYLRKVGLQ